MDQETSDAIARHVAGATVTHSGPFAALKVPSLAEPLTQDFIDKFVVPFYRASLPNEVGDFADLLQPIANEISPSVLTTLLSDFDWRSRITAAYFAAILTEVTVEDHIGKLLLRSDVCFAGFGYCLTLARFNSPKSVEYLSRYLEYYLSQPNLHFDQGAAIGAMAHLDSANGTSRLKTLSAQWDQYVSASGSYEQPRHIERFEREFSSVVRIAAEIDG